VNHELVGTLPAGSFVTGYQCVARDDGIAGARWCQVRLSNGLLGWASTAGMMPEAQAPQPAPPQPTPAPAVPQVADQPTTPPSGADENGKNQLAPQAAPPTAQMQQPEDQQPAPPPSASQDSPPTSGAGRETGFIKDPNGVMTERQADEFGGKAFRMGVKHNVQVTIWFLSTAGEETFEQHARQVFHDGKAARRINIFLGLSPAGPRLQAFLITDWSLVDRIGDEDREKALGAYTNAPDDVKGLRAMLDVLDQQLSKMAPCTNPENAKLAFKLGLQVVNQTLLDLLIEANAHAIGVENADGSKTCQIDWRMDIDKAREIESGILGEHRLTQMAHAVNQRYDAGNPLHTRYKIAPNGEGGFNVWHLKTE
jgi:hypothetical protein